MGAGRQACILLTSQSEPGEVQLILGRLRSPVFQLALPVAFIFGIRALVSLGRRGHMEQCRAMGGFRRLPSGRFWPPRFSQPSGIEESIRGPRELARRNMFESRTPRPPKGLARQSGTSAREFEVSLSWFAFHVSAGE